ncbi:MAG: hypothetical protein ACTSUI_02305 [Promethearchaeota archaeon]
MVGKGEIKDLLDSIIDDRDLISKIKFDAWNEIIDKITKLTNIVEEGFDKNQSSKELMVFGGKTIYNLRNETNIFREKCKAREELDKGWKGSTEECASEYDNYRKKCIPLIISIAGHLGEENPIRKVIEVKLRDSNYPMML